MSNILLTFVTSLVVGYSGALMPGPLLVVAIDESARRGFRVGPLLVAGHGIAELLLLLALAVGLSPLLQFTIVRTIIPVLGGIVLLWMGFGIVRRVWQGRLSLRDKIGGGHGRALGHHHVLTGALVSVSNPYWIIWWATVGAGYVAWSLTLGPVGLVSFYAGHIISDLTWYSFVAAIVAGGGRLLDDRTYQAILGLCGVFLFGLGIFFMASGLQGIG